jgi:hypothetical protein
MTLVQNPNQSRPTLSIGAKPLALEAFKSRLGLAEKVHVRTGRVVADTGVKDPEGDIREKVGDPERMKLADEAGCGTILQPEPETPAAIHVRKSSKRRPPASALPWPPRREWFPNIMIDGEPVQDACMRVGENAQLAAKFWARRVAFEAAIGLSDSERGACERFVLRHRLSILAAFERRLARADVVKAMRELWEQSQRDITPLPPHDM